MRSRLINDECSTHFLREVLKKNTNILYVFYLAIHEGKTHRVHKKCKRIKGNFLKLCSGHVWPQVWFYFWYLYWFRYLIIKILISTIFKICWHWFLQERMPRVQEKHANNQSDYYGVNSFYKDHFVVQNPKMKVESKFLPNGLVQGVLTKRSAGFFWVKIYPEKCDPSPRLLTQT